MNEEESKHTVNFNLNKMCRSCLKESEEDEMYQIFENINGAENIKLHQILMSLTASIQVSKFRDSIRILS